MIREHADLFIELLTNAGWLDDADELIASLLEDTPVAVVRAKCQLIDSIITEYNSITGADVDASVECEFDRQLIFLPNRV